MLLKSKSEVLLSPPLEVIFKSSKDSPTPPQWDFRRPSMALVDSGGLLYFPVGCISPLHQMHLLSLTKLAVVLCVMPLECNPLACTRCLLTPLYASIRGPGDRGP